QTHSAQPSKVCSVPKPLQTGRSDPSPNLTSPALMCHQLPTQFSEAAFFSYYLTPLKKGEAAREVEFVTTFKAPLVPEK
ncbi:MAG: hypothetical protein K9N47_28625, partial [Prosthecobacter sp.]|uniref:hypothetical protein n=1 Tax=Prosthecobacter sp. TaxID=1965333 RepID=UPI0026116235